MLKLFATLYSFLPSELDGAFTFVTEQKKEHFIDIWGSKSTVTWPLYHPCSCAYVVKEKYHQDKEPVLLSIYIDLYWETYLVELSAYIICGEAVRRNWSNRSVRATKAHGMNFLLTKC